MRILLSLLLLPFVAFSAQAQTLQEPSDVRNVQAVASDKSVSLTWDAATDDGLVVGYKVHYGANSVTEEGDTYDNEVNTNSTGTNFTVDSLVNGDTYYFAVTAVDDQGLESELYSVEVSATPGGGESTGGSAGAPILLSADHEAANKVVVVMSEPVVLDGPESAFDLTDDFTGEKVRVLSALLNSQRITLIIDPADIVAGDVYRVTATTGVTDLDGNPVSSGVVDSVEFTGQDLFAASEPDPEEKNGEEIEDEETLIAEEDSLGLGDILDTPTNTPDDFGTFFLDDTRNNSDTADFLDSLLEPDNPINNLNPEPIPVFEPPETTPEPVTPQNPVDNNLSSAPDQIPPQDARNLAADTSSMSSGEVQVTWEPALDIDQDIKDQILYTRVGLGAWDSGTSLGKDLNKTTVNVVPNQNYQVRLVTVDNAGNESFGAAFEFSTTLNQSGGGQGTVIALSLIAIAGFFFLFMGGRRA